MTVRFINEIKGYVVGIADNITLILLDYVSSHSDCKEETLQVEASPGVLPCAVSRFPSYRVEPDIIPAKPSLLPYSANACGPQCLVQFWQPVFQYIIAA